MAKLDEEIIKSSNTIPTKNKQSSSVVVPDTDINLDVDKVLTFSNHQPQKLKDYWEDKYNIEPRAISSKFTYEPDANL